MRAEVVAYFMGQRMAELHGTDGIDGETIIWRAGPAPQQVTDPDVTVSASGIDQHGDQIRPMDITRGMDIGKRTGTSSQGDQVTAQSRRGGRGGGRRVIHAHRMNQAKRQGHPTVLQRLIHAVHGIRGERRHAAVAAHPSRRRRIVNEHDIDRRIRRDRPRPCQQRHHGRQHDPQPLRRRASRNHRHHLPGGVIGGEYRMGGILRRSISVTSPTPVSVSPTTRYTVAVWRSWSVRR